MEPILDEIDVPALAQEVVENNVIYLTDFLQGDDWYIYFPRTTLEQTFTSVDFRNVVIDSFENAYRDLPVCTPAQELQYYSDTPFETDEQDILPPCKPQNFEEAFAEQRAEFEATIDEALGQDDSFEGILEELDLAFATERTPVENFIDNQDDVEQAEDTKETIEFLQQAFSIISLAGPLMIISSLFLIGIAGITRSGSILVVAKTITNSIVIIGVMLVITSLALIALRSIGLSQIPFDEISDDVLFDEIEVSIEFITRSISLVAVRSVVVVSAGLLIVSIVLRGGLRFVPSGTSSDITKK